MVDLEPMVTRDMLTTEMHTMVWDFMEKLTLAGLHDEGQAGGEGVTGLLGLGHCEGWGGFWGGNWVSVGDGMGSRSQEQEADFLGRK